MPLNLCTVPKTSERQGGIEPAIIPTEYSALVQVDKGTAFPIGRQLVEDQDGESRCSTYMYDLLLNRDFLSK